MSESEKKKRLEYRKKRKCRIITQIIIAIILIIAFIPLTLVSREKAKDVEINYNQQATIDYKVYLKDNDFYEEEFLGKGREYIASLIDNIVVDFDYDFALDKQSFNNASIDIEGKTYAISYELYGELVIIKEKTNNVIFRQKYPFVEKYTQYFIMEQATSIENQVKINYSEYNNFANQFINTYDLDSQGVYSSLILHMNTNVCGIYDEMGVERTINHFETLNIPLTEETIDISFQSSIPSNGNKLLYEINEDGQPYGHIGLGCLALGIIVILTAIIYALLTRNYDIEYDIKIKRLVTTYKSYIQKITTKFCDDGYQVLKVSEFNELLDIRDTLQAPILMYENFDRTMSEFVIPTPSKILYVFEIKVEDYDEIYGSYNDVTNEVSATENIVEKTYEDIEEVSDAQQDYRQNASYNYSFASKLHLSKKETKEYYKKIISFAQSYGVNVQRTWKNEKIAVGKNVFAILSFRGLKLSVAFKLNPNDYAQTKYKLADMSSIKRFAKTPAFMKVTSDRKAKWVIELLNVIFEKEGIVNKNLVVKVKNIPAKTKKALIKENLIKVRQKNNP